MFRQSSFTQGISDADSWENRSIPEATWRTVEEKCAIPGRSRQSAANTQLPRLQGLIIDCTGLMSGRSHIGIGQSLEIAQRLGARKTYLTDLPHKTSHAVSKHVS